MYTTLGMLKASAAAAATPTLATRSHNSATSAITSRSITMPATIAAGRLIVLIISLESGTITTPPAGYTQVSGQTIYKKVAVGTEGGVPVTFVVSTAAAFTNHGVMVFSGATQVAAAAPATAVTANANPPSLTVPWGAANNLFMAIYHGMSSGNNLTSYPANCPLYRVSDETDTDEYSAGATSVLATFDPDAFATDANDHKVWTLGVAG